MALDLLTFEGDRRELEKKTEKMETNTEYILEWYCKTCHITKKDLCERELSKKERKKV